MERGLRVLLVAQHFLVELLAFAQAGVLNLDVRHSAQLNHARGQVGDTHGLAHVEHEYLAAIAFRASFKYQFAGLGNEHEETDDVGMGDGDGASLLNLFLEQGNHRAVGAEHIAEAGCNKLRVDNLVERLHVNLADALRASHDVGRIDGLVGRHHDKLLHSVFGTEVGNDFRAPHIVLHALAGVVLHHRHVLVGSGMEYVVGLE